jgi:mRNA interferase MazF
MGSLAAGQVALLQFPFSDLSRSKLRPAVILAGAGRQDWIVCQITSNPLDVPRSVFLTDTAFASGGLDHPSYVRPGKIFTANERLIARVAGTLRPEIFEAIKSAVISLIRAS